MARSFLPPNIFHSPFTSPPLPSNHHQSPSECVFCLQITVPLSCRFSLPIPKNMKSTASAPSLMTTLPLEGHAQSLQLKSFKLSTTCIPVSTGFVESAQNTSSLDLGFCWMVKEAAVKIMAYSLGKS
jgi:hypothetical protein